MTIMLYNSKMMKYPCSKKNSLFFCLNVLMCISLSCAGKHSMNEANPAGSRETTSGNSGDSQSNASKQDAKHSFVESTLGYSVDNRPINAYKLGSGKKLAIAVVACLHGEEGNTNELAKLLLDDYTANSALIPDAVTLYFVPVINPDGLVAQRRENSHGVDLNKNFPTSDWKQDAMDMHSVLVEGLGGVSPGSEPEVSALVTFFTHTLKADYDSACVVALHSASPPVGYIQPSYMKNGVPEERALSLAKAAAKASGYSLLPGWVDKYPITGELIGFCAEIGIAGLDVELPTYDLPLVIPQGKKESSLDSCKKLINELVARGDE
jgi:predicted deacylase